MPGDRQKFFFCLCLLFIPVVPTNDLIIIVIIKIIIIPYFYSLLCYKPIRDKLQREKVFLKCFSALFLCFKVIRDIHQARWVFLRCFIAHFLCFKAVGNKKKCYQPDIHYLFAHLQSQRWSGSYLSMYALFLTASLHISSALKRSGTNSSEYGSMRTALSPSFQDVLRPLLSSVEHLQAKTYLFTPFRPRQGPNFMGTAQITSRWSFYWWKKQWKMMIQLLKIYI